VRVATKDDKKSILKMPPYSEVQADSLSKEDILVAESDTKVLGAISIRSKDVNYVSGEWKNSYEPNPNNLLEKASGCWISKLYVSPEYRLQGLGTKLLKEAIKYLKEKGSTEAFAGIYIRTQFREISQHVFRKNGFREIGSCICSLPEGYCRGTLLKRTIKSSE